MTRLRRNMLRFRGDHGPMVARSRFRSLLPRPLCACRPWAGPSQVLLSSTRHMQFRREQHHATAKETRLRRSIFWQRRCHPGPLRRSGNAAMILAALGLTGAVAIAENGALSTTGLAVAVAFP